MRLSKMLWFVSVSQISYRCLLQPLALANTCSLPACTKNHNICDNWISNCFIIRSLSLLHIQITLWQLKEAICNFSYRSMISIAHEQNIICSYMCTCKHVYSCRWYYAWADHHLQVMMPCALQLMKRKGKNESNDNGI